MLKRSGRSWKFSTLVAFDGQDGATPFRGLTSDASGVLYGTTIVGGTHDRGTVF
jgi:uncharacterized repeat protein (TIGR03803 family)